MTHSAKDPGNLRAFNKPRRPRLVDDGGVLRASPHRQAASGEQGMKLW
jgi:hypothetical protein